MRWFLGTLGGLGLVLAALWLFGPYEPVELETSFDENALGDDLDAYFAAQEAGFDDITPGVEKRIIWAGTKGEATEWVVLYVHGFSATSEEIRPVPDRVAKALGANIVFTRLAGHGRTGAAMAEPAVADWMQDVAEALAVSRRVGARILILSASTGGTLTTAAAHDPQLMEGVAGQVFVSPNYGLNNSLAPLLTFPAARAWVPIVAGADRSFDAANEMHDKYWTTAYPTVSVLPMAAVVKKVINLDHSKAKVPALFWFSHDDKVVRGDLAAKVAAEWGGPATVVNPELGPDADSYAHVIAGDVLSPGETDKTVQGILDWVKGL